MVLPVEYTKGLEFDAVLILNCHQNRISVPDYGLYRINRKFPVAQNIRGKVRNFHRVPVAFL